MTGSTGGKGDLLPELGVLPGHLFWRATSQVSSTLTSWAALLALPDGTVRSQQEVADAIGVSRTTMAAVATALAKAGHVTRVRNPDDRRSWALTRTSSGAAALAEWSRDLDSTEDALAAGLSDADRAELRDLLTVLVGPHLAADAPAPVRGSIGYLLTREHAHLHRLFAEALAPTGVEPRQFGTLVALRALGPTTQIGLARTLGVSGARMVWIADELEDKGYVERRRDPADRRAHVIHLVPAGKKALAKAEQAASRVDDAAMSALSPAQLGRLCALLRRVITG